MVMTTGFLRVFAPSVLLLLTTTTLVQLADSTTATPGTADVNVAVACETERDDCEEAETCKNCINELLDDKEEINQCGDALGFLEIPTTSAVESDEETCEEIHAVGCCLDQVTEDEQCLEDEAFVSYWICISEANGCIVEDFNCEDVIEELDELDSDATAAASVGIIVSTAVAFAGVTCASIVLQLL